MALITPAPKPILWRTLFKGRGDVQVGEGNAVVTIPINVYNQIHELCIRSGNCEVGWFGTIAIGDNELVVDNIYLLKQEVSFGSVDIKGLKDLGEELITQEKFDELNRLHFWGHCHPGDGVNPSGVDESTYTDLCKDCPSLLMGIFSNDATKAYFRLRHHSMNIRLAWQVVGPNTFTDFDDKVKKSTSSYSPYSGPGDFGAKWGYRNFADDDKDRRYIGFRGSMSMSDRSHSDSKEIVITSEKKEDKKDELPKKWWDEIDSDDAVWYASGMGG